MTKVFVAGASGFIGRRLIAALLGESHTIYALCRSPETKIGSITHENLHLVYGDLEYPEKISDLPQEIDAAYYLVHSMGKKIEGLEQKESQIAENFVFLMNQKGCQQIIYLGGVINPNENLSVHLRSRQKVESVLKKASANISVFRASIIIGSGSASFEIIRDLVEKLPVMIAPQWVATLCQPIAVSDVIFYLKAALLNRAVYGKTFDIGGPDIYSFKQLLLHYADFRQLKRYIINVPVLTPRLSSYWLVLITSVPYSLCSYLVDSMKSSSVCTNKEIDKIIPHQCLPLDEALKKAFLKNIYESSANIFFETQTYGCFKEVRKIAIADSRSQTLERLRSVGDDVRELIYKIVRRDEQAGILIIYQDTNLPGRAWIEFEVDGEIVYQRIMFEPRGVWGRVYWYLMKPFRAFIFKRMIRKIAGF